MAEKRSYSGSGDSESKKKTRREQKYRDVWEKEFPWLRPSKNDSCKAQCKRCGVEITAQLTTIKLHEKSVKHQNMLATTSSTKTIAEAFTSAQSSKGDSVKAAEIKLTAMMVEHNLSFRTADHLSDVMKKCYPDSAIAKEVKMKRTKCQNMW